MRLLVRIALILEGVKKQARRWEQAAMALKKTSKKASKKVEKKVDKLGRRGPEPGEDPVSFAHRVLGAEDTFHERVFGKKKIRKKLERLNRREQKRADAYEKAEQEESPEKREKRLRKAAEIDARRRQKQAEKDRRAAERDARRERPQPVTTQPRTPIPAIVRRRTAPAQTPIVQAEV